MKKFRYFFLALAALSLAAVSCQPEEEPFEPGEPDVAGCYGVYFPVQDASGAHTYDPTMPTTVEFTVKRTNSSGAITVPVKYTESESGMFQVGALSFADGQSETTLKVDFPNTGIGTTYSLSLLIDDPQYASQYNDGAVSIDFSVLRVEWIDMKDPKTNQTATVTFTNKQWNYVAEAKLKYYEVNGVRTCETYDETIVSSNMELIPAGNKGIFGCGENNHLHFTWFAKSNWIDVPKQFMGFDYNDGDWKPADEGVGNSIYVYDWFHYYTTDGGYAGSWPDWESFLSKNPGAAARSYYDGSGGFMLTVRYYIPGLGGWSPDDESLVGIVSGYTRVDYSFDVEADYSVDGETPIYIEAGVDIANVKYAVYEALKPAQVEAAYAAIEDGTDESAEYNDFEEYEGTLYGSFTVAPGKTGEYTIVLLAYDATGKVQNSAFANFRYIAAEDAADYEVDLNVFTEDTPERYRELHPYDSFAYGIYGSDLTDVHVGIFAASTVDKYGLDFVASVIKSDEDEEYAVSEDTLAEINADGGFYDVVTGLKAETTYYVIAWATNGDLDAFSVATYDTDPLPYVWNSLGKGQYTDDVACGIYGIDPQTVEVDLYEEATHPGFFKMTGHQLALTSLLFEQDMTPYEGVYWLDEPLFIDATDPESVKIELQNYGVMLNSGDGMIDGITSMYNGEPFSEGTYKDGVIEFPTVKGLLALIAGDGYYYANQHGAFKIVLPAKATSAPAKTAGSFDIKEANKTLAAPKFTVRYERDPQPVEVVTGAAPSRRAPAPASTVCVKDSKSNLL